MNYNSYEDSYYEKEEMCWGCYDRKGGCENCNPVLAETVTKLIIRQEEKKSNFRFLAMIAKSSEEELLERYKNADPDIRAYVLGIFYENREIKLEDKDD